MERYRVIKKLAEGGSGEAFLVWDKRLECERVMKCIRVGIAKERMKAVKQEIRLLKELHSRGIPTLTDVFYQKDSICLIMEYMKGISLEEKIKQDGVMNERQAIDFCLQITELLKQVHHLSGKAVHGDLKPLNVIWNEGTAALLDFGAAIFAYRDSKQEQGTFFTPGYAAPELLLGGMPSVESDIYALGAVLFYMVTGKAPSKERGIFPVREENEELSEGLEAFVLRCTKKQPGQRFHSIEDAVTELQRVEKDCRKRRKRIFRKRKRNRRELRNSFKTIQNILLTDGKRFSFVLNCLEREE